ncbi:hypothetical protein Sjap_017376 [Stephania japonica]|uniref:PIN-like protein n=1 Tax=Stephania japonica TaxID=461633 RepID=A0AAP0NLX6_9MAGN
MAAASIVQGVFLRIAIAALPQGILHIDFAKEYNVHPVILSTRVIFGMLIALPITPKLRATKASTFYKDLGIKEIDVFVSDGAKCDITRLQGGILEFLILRIEFLISCSIDVVVLLLCHYSDSGISS